MQLSIMALIVPMIAFVVAFLPASVSAQALYSPYVTFNNAIEDPRKSCPPSEWSKVTKAIDGAVKVAKDPKDPKADKPPKFRELQLRGHDGGINSSSRQLSGPCGCRYCWLRGAGCAQDPQRRRLLLNEEEYSKCEADFASIDAALDDLALNGKLTSSCHALVTSSRTYACKEKAQCQIKRIIALESDSGVVLIDNMLPNQKKLCNKARITFQAEPAFDYGIVTFDLKYPNGTMVQTYDTVKPFYMYENNEASLNGAYFGVGAYVLDVGTMNSTNGGKTTAFTVDKC